MQGFKGETTIDELSKYEYTRGMGTYRPHFEGIGEFYYPLSKSELFLNIIIVTSVIFFVLGLFVAFIFWVLASGSTVFVIVWVGICLILLAIAIVLFYLGGKDRRKLEKEMIEESNQKQQKMINKG